MAFQILPPKRPQQAREKTCEILLAAGWEPGRYPVALLGVRGYYLDTMGEKGKNDRKIYDDAIFLVGPDGFYAAFNANTDPGAFRKGIATLIPGTWLYRVGTHGLSKPKEKQYTALTQADAVVVRRDDIARREFKGMFGINIHRGSRMSVSSEGCQTIWPGQWTEFITAVRALLDKCGQRVIPYHLIEIAGNG